MNAVEIEQAVSLLGEQPFKADVGGVLLRGNIHVLTCAEDKVTDTLETLRESPSTKAQKMNFNLTSDGKKFQAEDLERRETASCEFLKSCDHFGFFLKLTNINKLNPSIVKAIKESSFDIVLKDPTYFLADVNIIETYKAPNQSLTNPTKLLHRFFEPARLDLQRQYRFGFHVKPRERLLAPLTVIEEAIQKLIDGTLTMFHYAPEKGGSLELNT